ncbi:polysaccharide deacetylase family protein [Spirillospora albida]|uniref:polysaccharide deacetylase family protein n=1 Tax=Spirillospora albida TaxID=58123 RepID=UPI0012FAE7FA|nr:polysaccharide deacetylase family protein [Spirillospora albida]
MAALPAGASGPPAASALTAAPADVPTHVPGIAGWPNGKGFDVVYRASTEKIAFRRLVDGAWSAPIDLGGRLVGGAAITFAGGRPHVFGRGTDGQLWQRVRVSGTWQAWTKVGGLVLSSAPAAAGRPDGRIDVFARDAADRLQTRTYTPGTGWGAWTSLGGTLNSAPAVIMTGPDSLRVVATHQDSTVRTRTLSGGTWSDWASLGGRTYSAPAVAADPAAGRTWVAIRDAETNRLHLRTLSGTWSAWQVMGGRHIDGPAASFTGGKAAVIVRGRDGALWARTVTGTTWSAETRAWVPGPPYAVPSALRGKNVTRISTTAKVAALTFDCAWSAAGVPSIRATLQRENVPATFFLVGDFARMFPVNANRLTASGFLIGNHSDNHPNFTKISDVTARTEITGARTAILNGNGAEPRPLFRFPYGAYTASDVTLVNGQGYIPVGWTVDSLGWKGTSGGQTAAKVAARVLAAAKPGMIVLMHVGDNPDDGTTLDADALPAIIKGLRDRGYTFTTLDALY